MVVVLLISFSKIAYDIHVDRVANGIAMNVHVDRIDNNVAIGNNIQKSTHMASTDVKDQAKDIKGIVINDTEGDIDKKDEVTESKSQSDSNVKELKSHSRSNDRIAGEIYDLDSTHCHETLKSVDEPTEKNVCPAVILSKELLPLVIERPLA